MSSEKLAKLTLQRAEKLARLEAAQAAMKARGGKLAKLESAQAAMRAQPKKRKIAIYTPESKARQCAGLKPYREANIARAKARQNNAVVIDLNAYENSSQARAAIKAEIPLCIQCDSSNVIRAGMATGYQRYRCKDCKRTWSGRGFVVIKRKGQLVCYRCGGTNCHSLGFNYEHQVRHGHCLDCRRNFTQGGKRDLEKNHLLLKDRIKAVVESPDMIAVLYQLAAQDVLEGLAYCWNVPLRKKDAVRELYGDPYQLGSDHPQFRLQQGQNPGYDKNY